MMDRTLLTKLLLSGSGLGSWKMQDFNLLVSSSETRRAQEDPQGGAGAGGYIRGAIVRWPHP